LDAPLGEGEEEEEEEEESPARVVACSEEDVFDRALKGEFDDFLTGQPDSLEGGAGCGDADSCIGQPG
jgi:hypothetical protein